MQPTIIEDVKHNLMFTTDQLAVIHHIANRAADAQIIALAEAQRIADPADREQTIQDRTEELTMVLEIQKMITEELVNTKNGWTTANYYKFPARVPCGNELHGLAVRVEQDEKHPAHLIVNICAQSFRTADGHQTGAESGACWIRYIPYDAEQDAPLYQRLINLETSSKLLSGSIEEAGKLCHIPEQLWFDFCGVGPYGHEEVPDEFATGIVFRVAESGVFGF